MHHYKNRYVGKRLMKKPEKLIIKRAALPTTLAAACLLTSVLALRVNAQPKPDAIKAEARSAGTAPPLVLSYTQNLTRDTVEVDMPPPVVFDVVEEEPDIPEPVAQPTTWWVTEDDASDVRGNACTIFNFVSSQWDDAYAWLQEHYTEGWPFGRVKSDRAPVELGPTIAMGIVANAMRESSCVANTQQGKGPVSSSLSAGDAISSLLSIGSSGGCAYGIIQWDGGRRENFLRFCRASGFDPRSLETQLYYMAYEYYASNEYSSYSALVKQYAAATPTLQNVEGAAELFRKKVERGGAAYSASPILESWGNKWHSSWGTKPSGGLFSYLANYMSTGVVAR